MDWKCNDCFKFYGFVEAFGKLLIKFNSIRSYLELYAIPLTIKYWGCKNNAYGKKNKKTPSFVNSITTLFKHVLNILA